MIYNIDVEVDAYQDAIVQKYATIQGKTPEELLVAYVNNNVLDKIDALLKDDLDDKIQDKGIGWVLSAIKAME